ncbi:MAG: aminotransferase class V-fold PLP-dependent enzyme [Planctomycetota bacterium]|nr:MAG: aminotransferase class V-fold PLP-dependent enzyme [Planctomycetota bacterium]
MGTGFLYVAPEVQSDFRSMMWGGTGRASHSVDQAETWPWSVEVGNLNLPGIVSMAVAAEALLEQGGVQDWRPAFQRLAQGLRSLPGVRVLGWQETDDTLQQHVPVASILVEGWDVHDLASVLDVNFGIETRAGYHCAAHIHGFLGSAETGGTLRMSTCEATPVQHVDAALQALQSILGVDSN